MPRRDVVAFVCDRDLHGREAGCIDVRPLASAIVERLRLWTADHEVLDSEPAETS